MLSWLQYLGARALQKATLLHNSLSIQQLGIGGGAMAKVVVVFDFDKTIIDCDSDNWVVEELDVHGLFAQLLPSLPWNRLMDKMMMELHSRGKTIQDIAECLKKVPLHPRIISTIKSAHASGYYTSTVLFLFLLLVDIPTHMHVCLDELNKRSFKLDRLPSRLMSPYSSFANKSPRYITFFIETVLKHNGLMDCFSEINTNPSYVDAEGRLRILQYHDVNKFPSHGCTSCPPNMCKGLVMKRIQASVSAEGEKQFIYVGDGKNDFCPALTLKETDALMPRKNFPLWELICNNKMLVEANIQEWSDWEELETKLHNLTNTIFIEEKCSVRSDQLVPVDCKFETSSISAPAAVNRNVLPVPQ